MRPVKMLFSVLFALTLTLGCGGDDGDGGGTPDAGNAGGPDAAASSPDAMIAAGGIGTPCTPDMASPQADCPAGFICLGLQGGSGSWCTKECTGNADTSCATGYTGPGWAGCFIGVDTNGDQMADFNACGVICQDMGAGVCTGGITCDGSCPGSLTCSGPVSGGSGQVATSCQ